MIQSFEVMKYGNKATEKKIQISSKDKKQQRKISSNHNTNKAERKY